MRWPRWWRDEGGFDRRLAAELERMDAERRSVPESAALPCTCGSIHFTAGGQVVTPRTDGRMHPSGGVLSCVRCGRRWAHCGSELVDPHAKALPPAWAAVELREAVEASQQRGGTARPTPEDLSRLRGATRRASASLNTPPRRGS